MLRPSSLLRRGALVLLVACAAAGPALAQGGPRFHYAVKVLCGTWRDSTGLVPRQEYATSVNILNHSDSLDYFRKILIVTIPPGGERAMAPLPRVVLDTLPAGNAMASECRELRRTFGAPAAFEGFLVIDSFLLVDVVAAYSVPGGVSVVTVPVFER